MSGRDVWNVFLAFCGVLTLIAMGLVLSAWDELSIWSKILWPFASIVWGLNFVAAYVSWSDR